MILIPNLLQFFNEDIRMKVIIVGFNDNEILDTPILIPAEVEVDIRFGILVKL